MIEVKYKIGKKKIGNWRVPIEYFEMIIDATDVRELNPLFKFKKSYTLPVSVLLGNSSSLPRREGGYCKVIDGSKGFTPSFYFFIDSNMKIDILRKSFCWNICEGCRIFLEWREGIKPDYLDVIEVFNQIANDLVNAYNNCIEEAKQSGETDEVEASFFENSFDIKVKEKEKMTRKICL